MNTDLIFRRLPSFPLLQADVIESLSQPVTCHLLKTFGLEDAVDEDSDLEDLQGVLFAFTSSFGQGTDNFHRLYELLAVFPSLDFELVQSLLESTNGKVSKEMIGEFVELETEFEDSSGSNIYTLPLSRFMDTNDCVAVSGVHTIDRKTVLIITDDDAADNNSDTSPMSCRQVLGVAMGSSYGLNALYSMQDSSHTRRRQYLEWGIQDVHVCYREDKREEEYEHKEDVSLSIISKPVYVTSVVFEYSHCLERMFDLFYYGWDLKGGDGGECWSPALEEAMLHLLISVDDDLVMLVRSWKSMMTAFEPVGGRGMSNDLENMLQMVQSDATEALRTQSANAIGRLHQVLAQFAEMSSGPMGAMANIPALFLHAIEQFVLAKLKAGRTSHSLFVASLINLIASGKQYSQHLKSINYNHLKIQPLDDFIALFEAKISVIGDITAVTAEETSLIESFFKTLTSSDVKVLEALKPCQLDSLLSGSKSSHYETDAVCYLPALSLQDIADPPALTRAVTSLAEKTYSDAITVGSAGDVGVGGYTMTPGNRSVTCAVLSSLLNAGVAYVASKETAKLMGHLPMWRSTLPLQPSAKHGGDYQRYLSSLPTQLKKRIKDMKRIFRNKVKKQLSFRLNFDISHAVSLLREHHGVECWVGQELEQVWNLMASTTPPQLMIFELYYGETLVAADFAHPICGGRTVYVATRFSARGHSTTSAAGGTASTLPDHLSSSQKKEEEAAIRTMQPGFILALLECRWLQQRGCELWDLGGYNLSPLMQYKLDLAGQPQTRPHGLYEFRKCLLRSKGGSVGIVNGSIDVGHPWIISNTDAGADIGAGIGEEDISAQLLSSVRSGDILIEDVKIEHLLGYSAVI